MLEHYQRTFAPPCWALRRSALQRLRPFGLNPPYASGGSIRRSCGIKRRAPRPPPLDRQETAEGKPDDEERDAGRHGAERVDLRGRHGGGEALEFQRQGVAVADRLRGTRDLVPGQGEAEQRDAHHGQDGSQP